jgi:RHS repeat-associated protein
VKKTVTSPTNSVTTYYVVDEQNPTGYAQVLEEHVSLNSQPSTLNRVYSYGHTLISQDRLDGLTWRTSFYGYDGHNNVRSMTDLNGVVTDRYDYDAFGNLIARAGTTPNDFLYCGEQYDPDLGLYFLRARYFNTDGGRFWSADDYLGQESDPLSLHKYLYAENDPVSQIDPTGYVAYVAEINFSAALIGALAKSLVVVSTLGLYGAHFAGRDYTVYASYDPDDNPCGHSFMQVLGRDGAGWRYDFEPVSEWEWGRARLRPWRWFKGLVKKEAIAGSLGGLAITKFNLGNLRIWESVIQGVALSTNFTPVEFPVKSQYSFYLWQCYEWTFGATLLAGPISLLPFPNGFGHYF